MKKIVIAVVALILVLSLGMSAFAANSVTTTKTEDTTTETVWGHHHACRNVHGIETDCKFLDADNDGICDNRANCDNNHAVRGSESGNRGHRENGHHRGMHHK